MALADPAGVAPVRTDEANPHERRELTALMGCRASVTVVGPEDPTVRRRLLTVAEWRLRELESRWSRFLPDSEITVLAQARGEAVPVSAPTRELVRHLVDAWEVTGGAFDPTLLPALVDHGYGTSRTDPTRATALPDGALPRFDPSSVEVDEDSGAVRLPPGGTLDPGGLGKGLAADLVVAELLDRGATGAMVEIGGDLRVSGTAPSGRAWRIDVEDPLVPEPLPFAPEAPLAPLAVVTVTDGGVATSSRLLRRWTDDDGVDSHHLLDPRTGSPAPTAVVAATVVTATGAWSEAFTKVAFLHTTDDALDAFDDERVAALVVLADGTVLTSAHWPEVTA